MNVELLANVAALIFILGGIIAILFPIAPSIPSVWFGIFIYAISHDFAQVNQQFFFIITMIAAATIFLDYALGRQGVQKLKASGWGVLGAVVGGVVGVLAGPLYTYLIGPLLGAIIFEMLRGRDQVYSYQSGNYTIVAFMGGTIVKLLATIAMVGLFILRLQGKL